MIDSSLQVNGLQTKKIANCFGVQALPGSLYFSLIGTRAPTLMVFTVNILSHLKY